MKSIIGQILLWAGFLSGALATVFTTYSPLGFGVEDIQTGGEDNPAVQLVSTGVRENSEASEKGLGNGDVIIELANKPVATAAEFQAALKSVEGAESVNLSFRNKSDEGFGQRQIQIAPRSPWSTINWFWYFGSVAACLVGIVLLKLGKAQGASKSETTKNNLKQIQGNLADLINNTEKLNNLLGKDFSPRQTLTYIEEKLADDFRDFADGRDSISAEHGLDVFASVMTQFAAGERSINRAWSASADGYVEEAATCVERGLAMLRSAKRFWMRRRFVSKTWDRLTACRTYSSFRAADRLEAYPTFNNFQRLIYPSETDAGPRYRCQTFRLSHFPVG